MALALREMGFPRELILNVVEQCTTVTEALDWMSRRQVANTREELAPAAGLATSSAAPQTEGPRLQPACLCGRLASRHGPVAFQKCCVGCGSGKHSDWCNRRCRQEATWH